jgi:hypothetical protein
MLEEVLPEGCTRVAGTDGRLIYLLQDNSGTYAANSTVTNVTITLPMLAFTAVLFNTNDSCHCYSERCAGNL